MANRIAYSETFIRKAKVYKKKHLSIVDELRELETHLITNPLQGNDLGSGLFKIRLAVKSKGKGKSGGYRVITYLVSNHEEGFVINMLTIYDKSEENSIDKKVLLQIIRSL
ncbi:hypothetical protein EZ449_00955 [Pedobacter frigidisoli]|uniref:RelE toxin of RelE / RelB toxin-antitoxin system n=1 Tax=Pedobacter frigidisoli TaxID=2530455 RepID=A0A4R0P7G7_9SPHI|nr:type II toxin-antitoxin system RelE/ParE family toxin [Pedobacter frigidisoli]TCD12645.1 hypothetical protein EZ449_00955 [Pedobacter frigidisoli]